MIPAADGLYAQRAPRGNHRCKYLTSFRDSVRPSPSLFATRGPRRSAGSAQTRRSQQRGTETRPQISGRKCDRVALLLSPSRRHARGKLLSPPRSLGRTSCRPARPAPPCAPGLPAPRETAPLAFTHGCSSRTAGPQSSLDASREPSRRPSLSAGGPQPPAGRAASEESTSLTRHIRLVDASWMITPHRRDTFVCHEDLRF